MPRKWSLGYPMNKLIKSIKDALMRKSIKEQDALARMSTDINWTKERQAIIDEAYAEWQRRKESGKLHTGICLDCGLSTDLHPMPERLLRSGPDLCARARESTVVTDD
jgi:hypothetical protein